LVVVVLAGIAPFGLAACGTVELPPAGTEAIPTDYRTFPPPTTTLPPTTTVPPEPGSILFTEATYVIAEGDYPFVVADRFGVDFEEFVALNGWTIEDGSVPEWPEPGTTIRIPAGATIPDGPSVLIPVPGTGTSVPAPGTSDPATGTSVADDGEGCGTYTIVEGDYLSRVATKLDTTVEKLDAANEDTDGYAAFYIGLKINVPC
jgi:LysM repeat protein